MFTLALRSSSISLLLWLILPVISNCAPTSQSTSQSTSRPTITVPPTSPTASAAANFDPANACLTSWSSYRSASISTDNSLSLLGTWATLPEYVLTFYDQETVDYDNITWTTLCDGRKREASRQPTTTLATSYSTSSGYVTLYTSSIHRTNKVPRCTYSRNDPACSRLWTSWSSSSSSLWSQASYSALDALTQYAIPPCDEPQWPCPVKPALRQCTVGADYTGTMYYWPVTTVSGDFCAQNGSTLTPTPTKPGHPNTVVYRGKTFTSPSVYLVYPTVVAYYSTGGAHHYTETDVCGPTITDITLTMNPESVFSIDFQEPGTPSSIYWDDFNTVRLDSYNAACPYYGCRGWYRNSIENYQPFIQIPHDILNENWRSWNNCTGWGYTQPKLMRLEPKMTTEGHWDSGAMGTMTAAPTGTVSDGLPRNTDSFP